MSVEFYGIPNCDTVKKARVWLEAQDIAYAFHDYKRKALTRPGSRHGATPLAGTFCSTGGAPPSAA
jgi:hypothetical protein